MRSFAETSYSNLVVAILLVLAIAGNSFSQEKIDEVTLLEKHLDSIGSAEARKARKSTTVVGTTSAIFKGRGEGRADGIVVLASQGNMNMIGMKFNNADYQFEKMGFDGNSFSVGFVRPGAYSVLGNFLRVNEKSLPHCRLYLSATIGRTPVNHARGPTTDRKCRLAECVLGPRRVHLLGSATR